MTPERHGTTGTASGAPKRRRLGLVVLPVAIFGAIAMIFAFALSGGDPAILFKSTISIVLWVMAAGILVLPAWLARRAAARHR